MWSYSYRFLQAAIFHSDPSWGCTGSPTPNFLIPVQINEIIWPSLRIVGKAFNTSCHRRLRSRSEASAGRSRSEHRRRPNLSAVENRRLIQRVPRITMEQACQHMLRIKYIAYHSINILHECCEFPLRSGCPLLLPPLSHSPLLLSGSSDLLDDPCDLDPGPSSPPPLRLFLYKGAYESKANTSKGNM